MNRMNLKTITMKVSEDMLEDIQTLTKDLDISQSSFVRDAIIDYMSEFKPFASLVHSKFVELSKQELYVTVDGDLLWEKYLQSFPEGTNPIFKTRTEHDCSCCKNFIRNIGTVVAVIDGKLQSAVLVQRHPAMS